MTLALTPQLRKRFIKQYVHVAEPADGHTVTRDENARLTAIGGELLDGQLPLIERVVFESGLPAPHFAVYPGASLPGMSAYLSASMDKDRLTIHVAVDAKENFERDLLHVLRDYLVTEERIKPENVVSQHTMPRIKPEVYAEEFKGHTNKGNSVSKSINRTGHRGLFDMTEGPDHITGHRKNTETDLKHYRRLRDAVRVAQHRVSSVIDMKWAHAKREEWEMWRDYLFEDKQLQRFDSHDWLRSLRVLNGISMAEMGNYLGVSQTAYSKYENKEDSNFTWPHCRHCLDHNIFYLPAEDDGSVKKEFAHKFLGKFNHEPAYVNNKNQLAAAVKARAIMESLIDKIDLIEGKDTFDPIDSKILIQQFTNGRSPIKIKTGGRGFNNGHAFITMEEWKEYREKYDIPASSDSMFIASHDNQSHILVSKKTDTERDLTRQQILPMIENAKCIGQFLAAYSEHMGLSTPIIGSRIGVTHSVVVKYHQRPFLLPSTLNNIIKTNAYNFPLGEDGNIHPEVRCALETLNAGERYHSPYLSMSDAGRALSVPVMERIDEEGRTQPKEDAEWASKIAGTYRTSDERMEWEQYWKSLEQQYKDHGVVHIDGVKLNTWLDAWDHLQVHRDDLALLAADRQRHVAVHRNGYHHGNGELGR